MWQQLRQNIQKKISRDYLTFIRGGIRFQDLNVEQVFAFQEDLLLALLRIEDVYVHLAEKSGQNCLIVFDRGTMDGSACSFWNYLLDF